MFKDLLFNIFKIWKLTFEKTDLFWVMHFEVSNFCKRTKYRKFKFIWEYFLTLEKTLFGIEDYICQMVSATTSQIAHPLSPIIYDLFEHFEGKWLIEIQISLFSTNVKSVRLKGLLLYLFLGCWGYLIVDWNSIFERVRCKLTLIN